MVIPPITHFLSEDVSSIYKGSTKIGVTSWGGDSWQLLSGEVATAIVEQKGVVRQLLSAGVSEMLGRLQSMGCLDRGQLQIN